MSKKRIYGELGPGRLNHLPLVRVYEEAREVGLLGSHPRGIWESGNGISKAFTHTRPVLVKVIIENTHIASIELRSENEQSLTNLHSTAIDSRKRHELGV